MTGQVRGPWCDSLLPWRDSLLLVEADGLPGTKHYAEHGSLATLCGLTDLYPVVGEAVLCDSCRQAANSQQEPSCNEQRASGER